MPLERPLSLVEPHDVWLRALLDDLRTPWVDREFNRNDVLAAVDLAVTQRDLLQAFIPKESVYPFPVEPREQAGALSRRNDAALGGAGGTRPEGRLAGDPVPGASV